MASDLAAFFGYSFGDAALLHRALTHSSAVADTAQAGQNNERLEFVGDRVLGLAVADMLYRRYPNEAEGALAKKDNPQARSLVKEARDLIAAMPVTEAQAASPEIAGAFTGGKEKGARQAELEQQWASFAKTRYQEAQAKAEQALKLAR